MKKFLMIAIFASFLIPVLSFVASAQPINTTNYSTTSNSGIVITELSYSPAPANPGEYIDLWIQAQNLGPTAARNATFILESDYPFSLDPGASSVYSFSNLGTTPVLLHYKVKVDENAVSGVNGLNLEYSDNNLNNIYLVKTFNITIENAQTSFDLVLQDSTSSQISLAIANTGENTANSMIVKIPDQEGFSLTGTNGQMVGNLDAGDYTLVSFDGAATMRSNGKLEVEIDYTDSIGVRRTVYKNVTISSSSASSYATMNSTSFRGNFTGAGSFSPGSFGMRSRNTTSWIVYVIIIVVGIAAIVAGSLLYRKNSKKIKEYLRSLKYKRDNKEKEKSKKRDSPPSSELPEWIKKVKESEKK